MLQVLDAFAGDAAWLARYARSRQGQVIPWAVIEAHLKATQPYQVRGRGSKEHRIEDALAAKWTGNGGRGRDTVPV